MNIEELNRRYGAPGRIVFRPGFGGHPEAVLSNKYGYAVVALLGGNVLEYRPTGHPDVLFMPARRDHNRSESLHGGIPVCWPQFGNRAMKDMPGHGFARFCVFAVRASEYSEDMTELKLVLRSSEETRSLWPHDFELELKVSVSMKLNLKLTTKNVSDAPFAFSAGFHPYLLVRERDRTRVRGLDGCGYVAEDGSEHVLAGDLEMTSRTDHVFTLVPGPKHEFALVDDGLSRAIAIASSGNRSAVVWNPGPDGSFKDLAADDWRRFVCVEPVTDWPTAGHTLAPGEEHSLTAAIQSTLRA